MTPPMPSRGYDSLPTPPSLPHNKAGSPPREDEEITSHDKPSGDDAQHDLLPMARSRYRNDQHDIAKRYNRVLDKTILKVKDRSNEHRQVLKSNNRLAEMWRKSLEVSTHGYNKAYEEALQVRVEADNIISFISLAEKIPASIKPSPKT